MKHSDLVNQILLYLSPLGVAWSNATGAVKTEDRFLRYGLKGSSDILACIGGRFVGVEVKVGRDRQHPEQAKFERAIVNAGGVYILARSVDDVASRLKMEGLA